MRQIEGRQSQAFTKLTRNTSYNSVIYHQKRFFRVGKLPVYVKVNFHFQKC